ncbi:DUF6209 family protein [Krasilnikovia sp. MM14-A1259]|uniref:DUF6209 family protein n=1 Tax=Krasilnikovia sp. MM14-A1259 TaxID=3373539 RepID=UPI003809FE85
MRSTTPHPSPAAAPQHSARAVSLLLAGVAATVLAAPAPASAAPVDPGAVVSTSAATASPVIRFQAGWTTTVDGVVTANSPVLVDYDPSRLPTCRAQYAGGDAWSINVEYRVDGSAVQRQPVTQLNSNRRQEKVLASLPLGAGAHELELWFVSGDRAGCHEYDSRYGANYRFTIAQ